jgi:uncharacterized protein YjbI with pentapeptide repeats
MFNQAWLKEMSLNGVNLSGADLSKTDLENVSMDGAILCHTKLPSGEVNSGCK